MYRKRSRQCCALMIIVSVCLRLCMLLGLDEQLGSMALEITGRQETAEFLLYLETGQRLPSPSQPERPQMLVVECQTVTVPPEPVAAASAEEITVKGACSYAYDKQALLQSPTTLDFSGDGPKILIVHSHSTEAYDPSDGLTYTEIPAWRTLDETRNVIAVGKVLAEELTALGVDVLHDTTVHDYPDYNSSYYNCLQSIRGWQEQYPGIQMVIDLHRDAVENEQGQAVAMLSEQEGVDAARLMLVVGTDEGGLEHPGWQQNLANALKLQSVLIGQYPGLCRSVDLRTERFNQHVSPGAVLVEVGTTGNTLTQAKASARMLAQAVAKTIDKMQQPGSWQEEN